ncbi:hypothetical protein EKO27_g5903 [Xylaria grammica]|uniref:C2H2-type domain-containing protein n=1 Tax=Xylaria grammica TaxID=363999 RepID=A0A439D473_9PEZI|nr:hypothetical protein EKO27_g5903 [Xylaria grammica]
MDQDSISSVTDSDYSTENDDESERRKMPKICLYFQQIVEQIGSLHEISSLLRRPTVTNKFIRSTNLGLEATTLQGSGTIDLNSAFGIFDNSHILEKVTQWRGLGKSLQSVVFSDEAVALVSDTLDYPEVRDIRWFCQRLARANTRRREQLQYWKTHPYDPAQVMTSANSIVNVHVAQVEDSRSQVSTLKPSNPHVSHEGPKSIVSKQSFSTVAVSDVQDAGTNVRPRTVYAPTVTGKDRPISIPRPPKTKDGETNFPCPYCDAMFFGTSVLISAHSNTATTQESYSPVAMSGNIMSFRFIAANTYARDVVIGHYGDSIPPAQIDMILDLCDRQVDPSNNHTEPCILCGKECPLSEWHDHVAAHMEDLSIFVLPAPEDDEGQTEGSIISGGADVLGSNDDSASSVSKASSLGFSEAGDHGQIPTEFAKIFADKEPGYASKFSAWKATDEDKPQRPLDSIFDPDFPPDLGEAMGGPQKLEDEKRESQLNAKSETYGYSNDNNIQNDQTVPSPSELSTKWPLDQVLSWLAANGFSKDWQETFKTLNLHGDDFLDLGGAYGGRGKFAKMHQVIFPQLALECGRSGTGWDQSHQREEGKRIRRLIRYLAADKLPESSTMQQSQDSTEILPKPAASGGLPAMITEVVNSYNLDWWELESFLNRIYPTTSPEEHALSAAGDHYLIYVPRPLTLEERGEIDEIRKQHWARENSTAGGPTKAVTTRQTDKMRGNALLEEDRAEQALKMTKDPETTQSEPPSIDANAKKSQINPGLESVNIEEFEELEKALQQGMEIPKREHSLKRLERMTELIPYGPTRGMELDGRSMLMRHKLVRLSQKLLGKEDPFTLSRMVDLAFAYQRQGHWEDAEHIFQRVLQGYEKTSGPDNASTIATVRTLGHFYMEQGRLEDAEVMYERALQSTEKVSGPEHVSTSAAISDLARLYMKQERLQDAEALFLRALQSTETVSGPEHVSTSAAISDLARLYMKQERLQDAEALFLRALHGEEKELGPEHLSVLNTVIDLGELYNRQGRFQQAEVMYERALQGYGKEFGPEHKSTRRAAKQLAIIYERQGRLKDVKARNAPAPKSPQTPLFPPLSTIPSTSEVRPYSCHACSAVFAYLKDLRRHMETVHRDGQEAVFRCNCGKSDTRRDNHCRHIRNCTKKRSGFLYGCKCLSWYAEEAEYLDHVRSCPAAAPAREPPLVRYADADRPTPTRYATSAEPYLRPTHTYQGALVDQPAYADQGAYFDQSAYADQSVYADRGVYISDSGYGQYETDYTADSIQPSRRGK